MCNCNVIIYFLLKRLVDIFWKTARIRDYKNNVQALHHEENVKEIAGHFTRRNQRDNI